MSGSAAFVGFDGLQDRDAGVGGSGDRLRPAATAEQLVFDSCLGCADRIAGYRSNDSTFACLLEERVPLNGGSFRNIDVVTRPGSVVHALYPAADSSALG